MEKLKAAVAAAEQSRRQAQDTTRACQDRDAALLAQRRRRLESGFAKVYEEARKQADADLAAQRASAPSLTFADEAEVRRVLQAASDHAVLQLPPGANAAVLRKRYRQMAVSLHPDKSSAPGAADAFHRLVTAYRNLAAFA